MYAKRNFQASNSYQNKSSSRYLLKPLALLLGAILFAACQFSADQRATPTETADTPNASISGRIWLDKCLSEGICPTVTPGTTQNTSDAQAPQLRGLGSLEVSLGQGPCPSSGLMSIRTDEQGNFSFSSLQPGFYCVTAHAADAMTGQWLLPEASVSDRSAAYTLALGPGEQRADLQFIWGPRDEMTPPAPTPTSTPAQACTNRFSLVADVTIPDGELFNPGADFTKVWRIRNEGTCTWSNDYTWVFVSGYQLGADDALQIPAEVAPGVMMDMSVDMQAGAISGTYRSYWMMRSPTGELFGAGSGYNEPVWVEIEVGPEPTPVITEWKGEYFSNRRLDGSPVLVRNDKNVDFDWGRGSPADGLPSDNFSVRWMRTLDFDPAIYRFSVASDDGVRLWVDDRLVIDEWNDSDSNRESVELAMVRGKHSIRVEYYERSGDAEISLSWKKVTADNSSQWVGRFWFNRERDSKWALVEASPELNFDWGSKSPALGIPADEFSASWTRSIDFESGIYRFSARSDDGLRFYLDDELLIDEWHNASASEIYTIEQEVDGTHTLQIIYYEDRGNASIEFDWEKIGPANRAPSANSDAYETFTDTAINILDPGVLENDSDPENDPLVAFQVSAPAHGVLDLHENGAFSYQPDAGFSGVDSFTYEASDGQLSSSETMVTITVRSENILPSAVDDRAQTDEDVAIEIDVLANDRGLNDAPVEISALGSPANGSAIVSGNAIRYTPAQDYSGEDSFTYTITDRDGDQSSAIVTVTISAVNDAPQAEADSYSLPEDDSLTISPPGLLGNDTDVDSTNITSLLVETTSHGTLVIADDGSFEYTPQKDYFGEDNFKYQASDGSLTSETVLVTLTVEPVEDPPIAVEDSYAVLAEPELVVNAPGVLANDTDADGDSLIAVLDQKPTNGTLDFNADGSFKYVPAVGFEGTDQFSYWVEDGNGRSDSVQVLIEVVP